MIGRALVIATLVAAGTAYAQEPASPPPPPTGERGIIGLAATLGVYSGIGGGVRIGDERIGVLVTAGWQPLLIATKADNEVQPDYHFHSTLQANADVYLLVSNPTPRSSVGLSAGYKGSTHLGHGVGAGFYAEIDNRKQISYFLLAGVTYFFSGEDRLSDKESYPMGTDFVFPGPQINYGANLGIVFSL